MDNTSETSTTSAVHAQLKRDIVTSLWAPGSKLGIAALSKHYGAGATPLREALNRLAAEGWVDYHEQRGFVVSEVSDEALRELIDTRKALEALAVNKSIARKTAEWEEKVVIALHRLNKMPRSLSSDQFIENLEWERVHREFHMALVENCGSRWLIAFCAQLYDQAYRYRRLAKTPYKPLVTDHHRDIVDAVVRSSNHEVSDALQVHYETTANTLLSPEAKRSDEAKGAS